MSISHYLPNPSLAASVAFTLHSLPMQRPRLYASALLFLAQLFTAYVVSILPSATPNSLIFFMQSFKVTRSATCSSNFPLRKIASTCSRLLHNLRSGHILCCLGTYPSSTWLTLRFKIVLLLAFSGNPPHLFLESLPHLRGEYHTHFLHQTREPSMSLHKSCSFAGSNRNISLAIMSIPVLSHRRSAHFSSILLNWCVRSFD